MKELDKLNKDINRNQVEVEARKSNVTILKPVLDIHNPFKYD